jgi:hypothetical protein
MAGHLGVAVEKASLFGQVQARSRHLEALNSIGAAVSRSLDLGVVLKTAVEKSPRRLDSTPPGFTNSNRRRQVAYERLPGPR